MCKGMKRFICEEEKFEINGELNRKPVQLFECGGDVLPGFGFSENPGC